MTFEEWLKGGLRYRGVKKNLHALRETEGVAVFFIGVHGKFGTLNAFNPFAMLRHEYVVALTASDVVTLKLRRPGVFGSKIVGVENRTPKVSVRWTGTTLSAGGLEYGPLPFHRKDARALAELAAGPSEGAN
ncbi:MAG TPA: hypothetical protein VLL27_06305 [Solirubrobacterales bacterium]|nr:hypothetical protein [Solirubrobacterales bacterium]